MNSYKSIREVSKKLRAILWNDFQNDSEIRSLLDSDQEIIFHNPTHTANNSTNRLSLWLYHLIEDDYLKNKPLQPMRGTDHNIAQLPPLTLKLFYMVTPFCLSGEADHLLLGKTMQVLYDNASFLLHNLDEEVAEELRIIPCGLSLEALTRIWYALREPYRLSVCYEVRVVRIASTRHPIQKRILTANVKS